MQLPDELLYKIGLYLSNNDIFSLHKVFPQVKFRLNDYVKLNDMILCNFFIKKILLYHLSSLVSIPYTITHIKFCHSFNVSVSLPKYAI